jgi:hypothetical protein
MTDAEAKRAMIEVAIAYDRLAQRTDWPKEWKRRKWPMANSAESLAIGVPADPATGERSKAIGCGPGQARVIILPKYVDVISYQGKMGRPGPNEGSAMAEDDTIQQLLLEIDELRVRAKRALRLANDTHIAEASDNLRLLARDIQADIGKLELKISALRQAAIEDLPDQRVVAFKPSQSQSQADD